MNDRLVDIVKLLIEQSNDQPAPEDIDWKKIEQDGFENQYITGNAMRIAEAIESKLLFDLDEIDNKPWRVFRQLAKLVPNYKEEYERYENFYANGGGKVVEAQIKLFEETGYIEDVN